MMQLIKHLISQDYLDESQVGLLKHRSALMGGTLDQHALEMGLLGVDELMSAYAECVRLPAARPIDLDRLSLQRSAAFPLRLAARWRFIPIEQIGLSWQVLSDQKPTNAQREEVRKILGVEVLSRAIPPFLFNILQRWLGQQPVDDDLALLTARLYPRFSVSPRVTAQSRGKQKPSTALEPANLSYLLSQCKNGKQALRIVDESIEKWAANKEVWRIQGSILKTQNRALTIDSISGLSDQLDQEKVIHLPSVDHNWTELCSDGIRLNTLALRPVHVHAHRVALLVIGSESNALDERTLARLDDTATALKKSLEAQLI
jgi:hypothetical protein